MNWRIEPSPVFPYPQGLTLRLLVRSPILAWRMGLGRILGHVFVLITTTGRKSGLPRRVVTEYFTHRGKLIVPCAYGAHSDWYRNIMANPLVTAQTWQGAESLRAVLITGAEEIRALYPVAMRRNPVMMRAYLRSLAIDPDDVEDVVAKRERIAWFRFEPTAELTPPPLMTDLLWLWPFVLGVILTAAWLWHHYTHKSDS
ncbi:MAG: nitroreductase family deazaflavin-dependent oxidoreductase [Anaerolineae bacterium]|nr:nitroreductase family deazaflavin-dependent oxidoreductase [Anaerolineae bacterium]